jgi:uncharacterized protein
MTHELEHSFSIEAAPAEVWEFLWHVDEVARCIPGCEQVTAQTDPNFYKARIIKKIGPFSVGMDFDIKVTNVRPPEFLSVELKGNDRRLRSQVTQAFALSLQAVGEHSTELLIKGNFTIEGLLGSLNRNLVSGQVSQVLDDFSSALRSAILVHASADRHQ